MAEFSSSSSFQSVDFYWRNANVDFWGTVAGSEQFLAIFTAKGRVAATQDGGYFNFIAGRSFYGVWEIVNKFYKDRVR